MNFDLGHHVTLGQNYLAREIAFFKISRPAAPPARGRSATEEISTTPIRVRQRAPFCPDGVGMVLPPLQRLQHAICRPCAPTSAPIPEFEELVTTYQGGYDVWAWKTRCNICFERLGLNPDGTPWAGPAGSFAWVVVCATKPRGHAFHKECIQRYQRAALAQGKQYAECPECRARVINVGGPEGVPLPPAAVPPPPAADVDMDDGPVPPIRRVVVEALPPVRRVVQQLVDAPEYTPRYNLGSDGSRTIEEAIQTVVHRASLRSNYDEDSLPVRLDAGALQQSRRMWAINEGMIFEAMGLPTVYFDAIFDYWSFYRAERDPSTPDPGWLTMHHFTRPITWGGVVTIAAAVQELEGDTADVLYAVAELFGRAHMYPDRAHFDTIFLLLTVQWQRLRQSRAPRPGNAALTYAGMESMIQDIFEDGLYIRDTGAIRQPVRDGWI